MPPWIKLHKALLDDRAFQCLPDASRALAPCLWLLASETKDGIFNGDVAEIAFRVRQTEKWVDTAIKPLISIGLIIAVQDASDPLADRKQVAPKSCSETEGETETETEVEGETEARGEPTVKTIIAIGVAEQTAKDWLKVRKVKRAPLTWTALDDTKREAGKAGITVAEAIAICARKNWQNFNSSWNWKGESNGNGRSGIPGTRDSERSAARRAIFQPTDAAERDVTGDSQRVD